MVIRGMVYYCYTNIIADRRIPSVLLQGSPVLVAKKDGSSSAGLGVSPGCGRFANTAAWM